VTDGNERSADCQDFLHVLAFTNVSGRSVFSRCFKYWNMNGDYISAPSGSFDRIVDSRGAFNPMPTFHLKAWLIYQLDVRIRAINHQSVATVPTTSLLR